MADEVTNPNRNRVSPESLLFFIFDKFLVHPQNFDRCLRQSVSTARAHSNSSPYSSPINYPKKSNGQREITNSDAFAKLGSFTSKSNDKTPLINSPLGNGTDFGANYDSPQPQPNVVDNLASPSNDETSGELVAYVHLQNSANSLSSDQVQDDTRSRRFKSVTLGPRVGLDVGYLLKSALAGGISCAFSAFLMHPVDTVKTQVQASTTLSFLEILTKIPEIGTRGLYKGSIPAVVGQFASHALRTSIYEASKLALPVVAPTLLDIQVQSVASFLGTVLGTTIRIPSEVLKQRLQANLFDNIVEATVSTWHQGGLKGLFRGTGITLMREVPFYVAGMGLYSESKKVVERQLRREVKAWETIAVGALCGGFTAVLTTPFDVIKTRMMTAPQGVDLSMWMAAYSIFTNEGPLAFYKGAVPRFFWTAPLGALNLAAYDLLQKAMIISK